MLPDIPRSRWLSIGQYSSYSPISSSTVIVPEAPGASVSVDSSTPARFDFFVESPGTFPIRLQESGQEIGRLVVSAA